VSALGEAPELACSAPIIVNDHLLHRVCGERAAVLFTIGARAAPIGRCLPHADKMRATLLAFLTDFGEQRLG
jgi:hypothetical protein